MQEWQFFVIVMEIAGENCIVLDWGKSVLIDEYFFFWKFDLLNFKWARWGRKVGRSNLFNTNNCWGFSSKGTQLNLRKLKTIQIKSSHKITITTQRITCSNSKKTALNIVIKIRYLLRNSYIYILKQFHQQEKIIIKLSIRCKIHKNIFIELSNKWTPPNYHSSIFFKFPGIKKSRTKNEIRRLFDLLSNWFHEYFAMC